jgi:hypothetical protein
MHFHPELGPAPTVGIEYEVCQFKRNRDMCVTAGELEALGFMPKETYSVERHDYHCRCDSCLNIGTQVSYPLMVKMQRDASLPTTGAEFITSPFPVTDIYMEDLKKVLGVITKNTIWTDERTSERGDTSTPGFHVHVHSAGPELRGMDRLLQKTVAQMYGFLPEIFTLATRVNVSRGMGFRIPTVNNGEDHHTWLAYAGGGRNLERISTPPRLEWRMFESPVDDMDYLIGSVYLAASLSQLMHRDKAMTKLSAMVNLLSWDDSNKSLEHILDQFSEERFELLRTALMKGTAVVTDDTARECLEKYLARI